MQAVVSDPLSKPIAAELYQKASRSSFKNPVIRQQTVDFRPCAARPFGDHTVFAFHFATIVDESLLTI
jgi:hypothetical protein